MTGPRPTGPPGTPPDGRAVSPAVGVAVLVATTTLLAAVVAAGTGAHALAEPAPEVRVTATVTAEDGWPDGQVLELTHVAGERLRASDLALVVALPRTGERVRLSGFPTRRLTEEHVDGAAVFDESYAGIDGAIDAAHTDGWWESGETAEVRIASGDHDVRRGDRVRVRVVHTPTNAVLAREAAVAA